MTTPGQPCPECKRRIPYPKKEDSPKTLVFSFRIPADIKTELKGLIDAASYAQDPQKDDGSLIREKPHWVYWTIWYALVYFVQDHFA